MPTTEFIIEGIRNEDDLRLVMNAIQDLPCINWSEVSMESGEAAVDHTAMLDAGDILAAVEDAGFRTR
ncbi:heavy-metal-associated domain-containing protein [Cognatazoarcus halotolerans]|uniref:heavy-metal-associated domain-containing protein n=1 Tax=Cognatazoarcus halotolerans TaxID=2686016 RepID=UPI00135794F7|nr:heavy metal-associated domain-containing protein [Cognatazoarcus halotolerans]MCB1901141.1 heavy-metal-associated domain-containing protein [Rhodocyclaceae bacterium]MCP5310408.1 heavy-metal-associated domain-containing protein [Zoogloeaceae bacterium]